MKIIVTGNLGYIGTELGEVVKSHFSQVCDELIGFDSGLFKSCISSKGRLGDTYYDKQIYRDIRTIDKEDLKGVDAIVHLAAVSNDPMGKEFEAVTEDINFSATCRLASLANEVGVKSFTFASSCSMYGEGGTSAKVETDSLNPLTAYARSKINVENKLRSMNFDQMKLTFLRFATACGASGRLRLDLVLNDFVASALKYKAIDILSDGSPWRPIIDVEDMCKAIVWSIKREGEQVLSVNVGSNEWNFQVSDLAEHVAQAIPGTKISVNQNAEPDKRSYKVNFDLYRSLAPEFYPKKNVKDTINELINVIDPLELPSGGFRKTIFIRLNHLRSMQKQGSLSANLYWS